MSEKTAAVSTKDLKHVLGFGDLMGNAVGQIIGSGIMSLTGIAIAYTGRSIPVSFLISAVLVLLAAVPIVVISGMIRARGGQYTLMALLAGERFAGVFILLFMLQQVALASYCISFAQYLGALFPALSASAAVERIVALSTLSIFYGINLIGVKEAAVAQKLIVVLMLSALGIFIGCGLPNVQSNYLSAPGYFSGGPLGVMLAGSMLTMAMSGGYAIVNLSAEAKNPKRDIPLAIIASTLVVGVVYALIGIVASGVLPVEQVANKPLSVVAQTILPGPLYVFFIVGGAMFALISTLNAQLQWGTKPLMQACEDGWMPRGLATLNKRSAPKYLLTLLWVIGAVPIVTGLEIATITNMTVVVVSILTIIMGAAFVRLPKVIPEVWAKSEHRISKAGMAAIAVLSVLLGLMNVALMALQLPPVLMGLTLVLLAAAYWYASRCCKKGRIHMEISYEET